MKQIRTQKATLLAMVGVLALFATSSFAELKFYDAFNYDAGNLVSVTTNWVTFSGTANQVDVRDDDGDIGKSLSYSGLQASLGRRVTVTSAESEDVGRDFTPTISGAGNSAYHSFLLKMTTQPSATGSYFAQLHEGTSTSIFCARVWTKSSGTGYVLGVSRGSTAPAVFSSELSLGTTYLIVAKYKMIDGTGNDETALWINPVSLGGSEPTPTLVGDSSGTDININTGIGRFGLRQATGIGTMEIDEVRVGTTWADVTPAAAEPKAELFLGETPIASGTGEVDFGVANVGDPAIDKVLMVKNTGAATLTLADLQSSNARYTIAEGLVASLAPNTTDTFTVRLSTVAEGTTTGTIQFTTNDETATTYTFKVTGTINLGPQPEVAVSVGGVAISDGGGPVDFGSATYGGAALQKVFKVENIGTAPLTTSNLSVPAGYSIIEGLAATIAAGDFDEFTVELPTSDLGTFTGSISFDNNDADENPFDFSVTGTINPGAAPSLVGVVPGESGTTLTLVFNKPMTDQGTYVAAPGGSPANVAANGNQVTLTFSPALEVFPTTTTLSITAAKAADMGTLASATRMLYAGLTTRAQLRTLVKADGSYANVNYTALTKGIVVESGAFNTGQATIAGSEGITLFVSNISSVIALGDEVLAAGAITNYNGLLELTMPSTAAPFIMVLSSGNPVPDPVVISVTDSENFAALEPYESCLVRINSVYFVSGPSGNKFPIQSSGSGVNYTIANVGVTPTLALRIDRDVSNLASPDGFDDMDAPTGKFDVIGILQQYDTSSPYHTGFQLLPRKYSDIIVPASRVPGWNLMK